MIIRLKNRTIDGRYRRVYHALLAVSELAMKMTGGVVRLHIENCIVKNWKFTKDDMPKNPLELWVARILLDYQERKRKLSPVSPPPYPRPKGGRGGKVGKV